MATITWLHLSDLHFQAEARQAWDEDVVLRALLVDVREQRAAGLAPDLILVSGDVAFSGAPAEYDLARAFFDELLAATGLERDRLFLVPGNHDVDRAKIGFMARQTAPTLTSRDAVNALLADADARRTFFARFEGYAAFVNGYLGAWQTFDNDRYFYVRALDLAGCRLAVLGLNSAWLAQGGDEDRHRLALGERQVRAALDAAREAELRIALLHHPFEWLQDGDREDSSALLAQECAFVLQGHMHQVGLLQARTPDSNAFLVAAGACYETRQHPNAYNFVRLDPVSGQGTVYLRAYSDRRGGFWTKDTLNYRHVPDGEYRFSLRRAAEPSEPAAPAPSPIAQTREELVRARRRYLAQLRRMCNALPLAALGGEQSIDEDVTLDKVYVALDTNTRVPLTDEEKKDRERERERAVPEMGERDESRPLAALEAAVQSRRLALLGEPGGGKSTFVRQLVAWLAAHQLGEGAAPPEGLHDLLPVLVTLRDLVPHLQGLSLGGLPADRRQAALAHLVRDQALADLERMDAEGFAAGLKQALAEGDCLVAFDGLDEVPPVLRSLVREAIQATIGQYDLPRVVVTCRVRSYTGQAVLPHFDSHVLAPFDEDKVRAFVAAWYIAQRDLGRVDALQAEEKAADLQEAALGPELRELAANPMLLTTMAVIHQREIGLPKERVRLYDQAVNVLLSRWQKHKAGAERDLPPALLDLLDDDRKLREIVERLAYEAHSQGRGRGEAADLARDRALILLESPAYLGDAGLASQFLDYVDRRAGLLLGRGGAEDRPATYSFPHRTFQEYLAGCHIVGQRDANRELWNRVREGDYWQLAAQLGAEELLYNRRSKFGLLDLAYRLCPAGEPGEEHVWRAVLWSGRMAALLGRTVVESDSATPDCGPNYLDRLLARLVGLLAGSRLDAHERAAAGQVLAQLGDPRFRTDAWSLPGEPLLGFVEVPGGAFRMGEDEEQHKVNLPAYYVARYPVTHAQYLAFVQDTGHKAPTAETDWERPYEWRDGQPPPQRLNQPVVLVTWHDARAYCAWLTERLQVWQGTPQPLAARLREDGWAVRLPTEAEWEKAARGTDGRAFPWGDEAGPDRANYGDTGIGTTSTVGCFPGGASPYGALDLSGNVWEWCRSLYRRYPYKPKDGREKLDDDGSRVLRGGAFLNVGRDVRCASRGRRDPNGRNDIVGFRLVVAPG